MASASPRFETPVFSVASCEVRLSRCAGSLCAILFESDDSISFAIEDAHQGTKSSPRMWFSLSKERDTWAHAIKQPTEDSLADLKLGALAAEIDVELAEWAASDARAPHDRSITGPLQHAVLDVPYRHRPVGSSRKSLCGLNSLQIGYFCHTVLLVISSIRRGTS